MVQIALPTSTALNEWTVVGAATAHEATDEGVASADDATSYVKTTTAPKTVRVKLSSLGDPLSSSGHVVRLRQNDPGITLGGGRIWLKQNTTTIWTTTLRFNDVWTTNSWTLSGTEADSITDYTDLYLEFQCQLVQAGTDLRISAWEFEVPDEPPPPPVPMRVTRQVVAVAGSFAPPYPLMRVTRQVVGIAGSMDPSFVVPKPLPAVLPRFFLHNWTGRTRIETAWLTTTTRAHATTGESRVAQRTRPIRTQTARFTGLRRTDAAALWWWLMRHSDHSFPMPLYADQTRIAATSSGSTIWCDPTKRRFYRGQRVLVMGWGQGSVPVNVEYAQIRRRFLDRLDLEESLSSSFPAGSRVYPLMDVEVELASSGVFPTPGGTYQAEVVATECPGPSALPASSLTVPTEFPTRGGRAILTARPNWAGNVVGGVERAGDVDFTGIADLVQVFGARGVAVRELPFDFLSRDDFWSILRFFDGHLGRAHSWLLPDPAALLQVVAVGSGTLQVVVDANVEDLDDYLDGVAVTTLDGTIHVRDVDSVADDGGGLATLTLDEEISGLTLDAILRAAPAYVARFKDDVLVEEWEAPEEVVSVRMSAVELLDDVDAPISNVDSSVTPADPVDIDDLYLYLDASLLTWNDWARTTPATPGDTSTAAAQVRRWDDARGLSLEPNLRSLIENIQLPDLIEFDSPAHNGGRRALQYDTQSGEDGFELENGGDAFFSNTDGLTIFINVRHNAGTPGDDNIYFARNGVLEWKTGVVEMYETLDTVNSALWVNSLPGWRDGTLTTLVLVWDPGVSTRVYRDGVLQGSASSPVSTLPTDARDTTVCQLDGEDGTHSEQRDEAIGIKTFLNRVLVYRRALSTTELNAVGAGIATVYSETNPWTTIV